MQLKKFLLIVILFSILLPAEASARRGIDTLSTPVTDSVRIAADSTAAVPQLDSAAVAAMQDSLRRVALMDSLDKEFWTKVDTVSLPYLDSTYYALYDSLARFLPDTHDIKRAIRKNRKEYRDSVRISKPRILEAYAIPDSLYYRRLLVWTADSRFNELKIEDQDTSFNYHFHEYPMYKKDVNATYLGTVGSATQYFNYFKREKVDDAPAFTPYIGDSYTPDNLPQYNVKKPYTELAYWGTLFAIKEMEENNLNLRVTQNFTPALNMALAYQRYGSRGMLKREATDNRTTSLAVNYAGKRYMLNSGIIWQTVKREENGGIQDSFWIRDTLVDTKTIDVNLADAKNEMKRLNIFVDHNLAIPMNFFRKNKDSLKIGEGTTAYVGHFGEFSMYRKDYTDVISASDAAGRDFYFNRFYINGTTSHDEANARSFNNKFFIKMQPFAPDAVVSKLNAGIGYQILSLYQFDPTQFVTGKKNIVQNNLYGYAGVSGRFRKYFEWEANADYYFAGYRMFDFDLNGRVKFSFYPIDKGIHLSGKFSTSLNEPHYFVKHVHMNHHYWDEEFKKTSETKFEATLSIPKWKIEAFFGYSLIGNMIYYDQLANARQYTNTMRVMTAYLMKNFKLWAFHFDNKVLFQTTSDQYVMPLPKLALNLRYYVEFPVVRDVLRMQIGVNGTFHSKYYAQSYAPDLGVFYNQEEELIGNVPYCDIFVNMQWKRACIFVKYNNAFKDKPESDYFSAYHYIRPCRDFKVGIYWPFR